MQGTLQFRRLLILESCHISKVANGDDFFGATYEKINYMQSI